MALIAMYISSIQWRGWRRVDSGSRSFCLTMVSRFSQWRRSDTYGAALSALDSLQSNAAALQQRERSVKTGLRHDDGLSVRRTRQCLHLLGIGQKQLQALSIIHVAGSKGKGSVCAMTEALLRAHGLRTGFYSSPHLVTPRERIRLNGVPLSESAFARYFWHVHAVLRSACDDVDGLSRCDVERLDSMPMYFMFMTVLGYYVFVRECVDVAVVEVGLGGRFDCTNVVERPTVCGITCLDYDHTSVLGSSIEQIAAQKAGIMKPGVKTFVADQPLAARTFPILSQCAAAASAPLYSVPPLSSYTLPAGRHSLHLSLAGQWQEHNAALALQLWRSWRWNPPIADHKTSQAGGGIETDRALLTEEERGVSLLTERESEESLLTEVERDVSLLGVEKGMEEGVLPVAAPLMLTELECTALEQCQWPGRCQTIRRSHVHYHMDGAHTVNSVRLALRWYRDAAGEAGGASGSPVHVLVVYVTGDRDIAALLHPLVSAPGPWQYVVFCNTAVSHATDCSRQRFDECERLCRVWITLAGQTAPPGGVSPHLLSTVCVRDAVNYIERTITADAVRVFVVGSLHLVGGFLSVIDPQLSQPQLCVQCDKSLSDGVFCDGSESDDSALVSASSDG